MALQYYLFCVLFRVGKNQSITIVNMSSRFNSIYNGHPPSLIFY